MYKVFLPQFLDASGINAQCLNAKALISHFKSEEIHWTSVHDDPVSNKIRQIPNLDLHKMWPWRFWRHSLFLQYLAKFDAIFYANIDKADIAGLKARKLLGRRSKYIATIEGLIGNEKREKSYSEIAGHPVYCQHVADDVLARSDYLHRNADLIIAISPFLAKIGKHRFGDKFVVLPLGIDGSIFYADKDRVNNKRPRVVTAGSVKENKRPDTFLQLAKNNPDADFVWFGDGVLRMKLIHKARQENIGNLRFPGALQNKELANEFRRSDIFVLPSKAEGVPKVTQEAAACGLPIVLFGYYEAPTVINEKNGFVVWNDSEFNEKVTHLIQNPSVRSDFGNAGAKMSLDWEWSLVAEQWQEKILSIL